MTSYHGGKQKIGRKIAEKISESVVEYLPYIKGYCEPFCGMLGVYRHIPIYLDVKRYKAGDCNKSLILM